MPIITSAAVAVSVSVMRLEERWVDTWASSFRHISGSADTTSGQQACVDVVLARAQFFELLRSLFKHRNLGIPPQRRPIQPHRVGCERRMRSVATVPMKVPVVLVGFSDRTQET